MSILINQEMCTGCGACVDICPQGAIRLVAARVSVNQEKCTACGQCVDECPSGAISLVPQVLVPGPQMYPTIKEDALRGEIIAPETQPFSLKKAGLAVLMERLLPAFADILISSLKQRLLASENMSTGIQPGTQASSSARLQNRPRQRRRRAGRKWSKN